MQHHCGNHSILPLPSSVQDFPLPDVSAIFRQPQMMAQDWAGPPEEPVVCKRDRRPSEGGRVRSAGSSEDISPSEC